MPNGRALIGLAIYFPNEKGEGIRVRVEGIFIRVAV